MPHHADRRIAKKENASFSLTVLSVIGDREEQQDHFGYCVKEEEGLIVVCDGMGGHEGGGIASELAVEAFLKRYEETYPVGRPVDMLIDTAKKADAAVSRIEDREGRPLTAGCTLVAVHLRERKLIWCSVGDSRAYLLRRNEMVQLTQDHNYYTVLCEKKRKGMLDEAEFEKERKRGEALISYLGIGNLGLIDYSESPLTLMEKDKILIMTDGLYKLVSDDEMLRLLDNFSNPEDAVQALDMKAGKKAKKGGESRDNMTVALINVK